MLYLGVGESESERQKEREREKRNIFAAKQQRLAAFVRLPSFPKAGDQ